MADEDRLLTPAEVRRYLGVGPDTLAAYRDAGLPFVRLNATTYRYYRSDVDMWLRQFRQAPDEVEQPTFQEAR